MQSIETRLMQAAAQETDLADATRSAADSVCPPFTPRQRLAINAAFAPCLRLQNQIYLTLNPVLWSPDLRNLRHTNPVRQQLDRTTRRLACWNQTYQELERIIRTPKLALPNLHAAPDNPITRQLLAYDGLLYRLHYQLGPAQHKDALLTGHHNDIPMAFSRFLQLAQFARRLALAVSRRAPVSFLDVGCGIGLKVLGAAQFFETAQGLDYDQTRIEIAQNLVAHKDRPNDRAFQADGITFGGYGDYDVIYAYQPMADEALQIQMDRHIAATARPGTVLIMPHVQFPYRYADYGCHQVIGPVHLAGYDGAQAKPVLRRLAHIGQIVPKSLSQRSRDQHTAAGLCDALRAIGHLE